MDDSGKLPVALTLSTNQLDCFRRGSSICAVLGFFALRCPVLKNTGMFTLGFENLLLYLILQPFTR